MENTDHHRWMALTGAVIQAVDICEDHEILCKCPVGKLKWQVIAEVNRLNKLLVRLDRAEKKEQIRRLIGVNPPCKK